MEATNHVEELAPPKNLSHHFSRVTKNRQVSSMKDFYKYFLIPGIGNLAGGMLSSPNWCDHPNTCSTLVYLP